MALGSHPQLRSYTQEEWRGVCDSDGSFEVRGQPCSVAVATPWHTQEWSSTRLALSAFKHGFPRSPQSKVGGSGQAAWPIPSSAPVCTWILEAVGLDDRVAMEPSLFVRDCPYEHMKKDSQCCIEACSSTRVFNGLEILGAAGCIRLQLEGYRSFAAVQLSRVVEFFSNSETNTVQDIVGPLERPSVEPLNQLSDGGKERSKVHLVDFV